MTQIKTAIKKADWTKFQALTSMTENITSGSGTVEKKSLPLSEPLCPACKTPEAAGFFRYDVSPGDPNFGKLDKCHDLFHSGIRQKRQSEISQLGEEDLKRQLLDIHRTTQNEQMLDAARRTIDRGYGWLYIWGGPGNAKSEVLKAIVNECFGAGRVPAIYAKLNTITDHIKAGFANNTSAARLDELRAAPVLAIDEMDKPQETEWMEAFRFNFLDDRYMSAVNKTTLTVFAGNADPSTFDDVLYDRIRDGRFEIAHNSAPSARRNMRWD